MGLASLNHIRSHPWNKLAEQRKNADLLQNLRKEDSAVSKGVVT